MFTPDFLLRAGDRNPSVRKQVTVDGVPVNLTGGTGKFEMFAAGSDGSSLAVDGVAVIEPDVLGWVRYDWAAGDASLTPGMYFARFETTIGGKQMTAPNGGWLVGQVTGVTSTDWSYSGDPAARDLDWVRFNIGDTNPSDPRISDPEIESLLAEEGDKYRAAVAACEMVAGVFAAKAITSKSVGDLSISYEYGTRAQTYLDRAERLRVRAIRRGGAVPQMATMTARITSDQFGNA